MLIEEWSESEDSPIGAESPPTTHLNINVHINNRGWYILPRPMVLNSLIDFEEEE